MYKYNVDSPAGRAMDEAIELAIAEDSPYPEAAMFINVGTPFTELEINEAFAKGLAAVLAFEDGSTQVVLPESIAD